mmetsp:Transcript_11898/g.16499  ORF Transcript_11898/g.16499 Transcript_11898/m.16499 type:complete len:317 (+) Transcript_11898:53-1003(+)
MASDALADLDDLLNELDNSSRKSVAPQPVVAQSSPKSSPAPAPAPAPTPAPQSSGNNSGWKDELEGLLNELSVAEGPKSHAPAPTPISNQNQQPRASTTTTTTTQVRTIVSGPPPTFNTSAYEEIIFAPANSHIDLTLQEGALLKELNRARTHPHEYADILERDRKPYFDGKNLKLPNANVILVTEEGVGAVNEAIDFLRKQKPLPPFALSPGMTKAAREAIAEVGKIGDTACESIKRFDQYGRFEQEAVEIASFGTADAKEIVIRFLICDGSSDRIQRAYIFEPIYGAIGLSVGEHNSQYKSMACINFTKMFHPK